MILKTQFVIALIIFSIGCAHKRSVTNPKFTLEKDITLSADFIKAKKDTFDLGLTIYNEGNKPFEKNLSDFSCGKGGSRGDFTRFQFLKGAAGIQEIKIPPKKMASYLIVCKTIKGAVGNYYLSITKTSGTSKKPTEFEKWELIPNAIK